MAYIKYVGKSSTGYADPGVAQDRGGPEAIEGIETVSGGYSDALYAVYLGDGPALSERDQEWLRVCAANYNGPVGKKLVGALRKG